MFTEKNLEVLKSFSIVDTLYAFDFDGTLSPIVDTPDKAYLPESISEKLCHLNDIVSLAIITGRSLDDIKKKFPFKPKYIIGNHGIEYPNYKNDLNSMKLLCKKWLHIIDHFYSDILKDLEILVENKEYSLSFHYRGTKNVLLAEDFISKLLLQLPDSKSIKGKFVMNVIPEWGMNKGEALKKLLSEEKYRFCIYIGDDVTDEDIFKIRSPELLTVKIGKDSHSSAKYYLNEHTEVERFLEYLLQFNGKD